VNPGRRVIKNTSALLASQVFSICLGLVYLSALARYVQPVGIGKIGTATSLMSMAILLATFGFSQLIIRDIAVDESRAGAYVSSTMFLRSMLSIVVGLLVIVIARAAGYPDETRLVIYIYCVAYAIDTLTDVAFSVFDAHERMEYRALIQAGRDLVNVGMSLMAIHLRASLVAIVMITALANALKLAVSMTILRWRFVKLSFRIDWGLCRRLIVLAIPFAVLSLVNVVDRQIDTFVLSLYRPAGEVGWLSAANTIINYLLIAPTMLWQAVFPVFAKFHGLSENALERAYRISFRCVVLVGFPLCVGTIVTADQVIGVVYGPGFEGAATALRILAPILLWMFGFVNGALLNATDGQGFLARVTGLGAVINVVCAFALIPAYGYVGASVAGIMSGVVLALPIAFVCHRRLRIALPYGFLAKSLAASIAMGGMVGFGLRSGINLFAVVFLLAPMVYGAGLYLLKVFSSEDATLVRGVLTVRRA
jgi:O-antigen/teichoic acid export membrane protein